MHNNNICIVKFNIIRNKFVAPMAMEFFARRYFILFDFLVKVEQETAALIK